MSEEEDLGGDGLEGQKSVEYAVANSIKKMNWTCIQEISIQTWYRFA
ncbi:MAG TPA: hypothetical protein VE619_02865 [Nitrososphaeraceae archaeon]|nr:hypothetical protein [Nitrososphaeraceae archaeon]